MPVKLHRCPALWLKTSHHPCWRVQKALDETGVEYELVKAAWPRRSKRTAVIAGTGQSAVPAIELEDGTWYREDSAEMARAIRAGRLDVALMRICSLLPSATEIVADLGLVDSLVGVSEECRWPPEVVGKPIVTAPQRSLAELSSVEIDATVRASLGDGGSLYAVDAELIESLAPDLIVTQDLCPVCAVSSGDLTSACVVTAEVVSLDPMTLDEVAGSVELLAQRLGVAEGGARVAAAMRAALAELADATAGRAAEAHLRRRVDRAAVHRRALGARDGRGGRRRRCPRSRGRALPADDVGRGARRRARAGRGRGVRVRRRRGAPPLRRARAPRPGRRRRRRQLLLATGAAPGRRRPPTRPSAPPGARARSGSPAAPAGASRGALRPALHFALAGL